MITKGDAQRARTSCAPKSRATGLCAAPEDAQPSPAILLTMRVAGWRASPGTPGKARCGLQAIVYRRRSIRRWRVGGSSNASRYPRSFRPAGCIGPRNGICAKSLSCLLVAGPFPLDLFLSAKHLLFAAIRLMALIKIADLIKMADLIALAPRRARMVVAE